MARTTGIHARGSGIRVPHLPVAALVASVALTLGPVGFATPPGLDVHQRAATGSLPKGVSISPDGRTLYVTAYGNAHGDNVDIFDAATLRRTGRIYLPGVAVESAVSPDGATLYVSDFRRNSVYFVDTRTRRLRREARVGAHPKILAVTADGSRVFAANWGGRSVTELDAHTGEHLRTLHAGRYPRGMAVRADGTLYVANFGDDTLDIYAGPDRATHRTLRDLCRVPRHLALSPDGARLYVSCLGDSRLAVLDTSTERVERYVAVGRGPKAVDVFPDGAHVVTADYGGSSVTLVDTRDWTTRTLDIPSMDHASGIVTAREGMRFFVTGWYDNHLYAIGVEGAGGHVATSEALRLRVLAARAWHEAHPVE